MTIKNVLEYFYQICAIPHGSGNMEKISEFCVKFAVKNNLKYVKDSANNVIIYKNGTIGFENSDPIILQGHIDMVCQKTPDKQIDFKNDPIEVYQDGDYLKANGTTLGADNGIAVAMIMTILASKDIPHPPIEAVFTTDEEIGMIGASALDFSLLKSKKMINLDTEDAKTLTVSCAGGSDFKISIPTTKTTKNGVKATVEIKGLLGGHSGVEINKGRINANILLGRILNHLNTKVDFETENKFRYLRSEMMSDLSCEWTVAKMAKVVNLSESRFFTIYKMVFGISPNADIINARIDSAKNMLCFENKKVGEIAESLGYQNTTHFIRQFKGIVGQTPSEYKCSFNAL